MIRCPQCGGKDWTVLHRSAIEPAEDKFRCHLCSQDFHRYDPPRPAPTSPQLLKAAPALLGAARIALLILCRDGLQPLRGTAWNDSELRIIRGALVQAGESLENYDLPEGIPHE